MPSFIYFCIIMKEMTDNYDALKRAVEKTSGRRMLTPRDFEFLAMRIFDSTHSLMSPTTLKRFWGYLDNGKNYQPRRFTLDLLSVYVGYKNWDTYCESSSAGAGVCSDYVKSPSLYATSLAIGCIVKLLWSPDRCVSIRYMGDDMFEVIKSINSKLQEGDRFCCGCFIENEPLYLTRLVRDNSVIGAFVCGHSDGIKYIIESTNAGGGVTTCTTVDYALCQHSLARATSINTALTGYCRLPQRATLANAL